MKDTINIIDNIVSYSLEGIYLGTVVLSDYENYDLAVAAALDKAKMAKAEYISGTTSNE